MRRLYTLAISIVVTLTSCASAFAEPTQWPIHPEGWGLGMVCPSPPGNPQQTLNLCRQIILSYFEPACLSSESQKIRYDFAVGDTGKISAKRGADEHPTDSDRFYCELCLWETSPMKRIFKGCKGQITFSGLRNENPHQELRSSDKALVYLHFVPVSVTWNYRGVLSPEDIYAPYNVVGLRRKDIDSPRFRQFKREWLTFFERNPSLTREQLLPFQADMRKRYEKLFVFEAGHARPASNTATAN